MKYQGNLAAIIFILGMMISASTATYNPTYGKMFSEYSQVTYCNDKNQINWTCGSPCKRVQKLQSVRVLKYKLMEAEGIIGYNPLENAVVAAFRGTVPWEIQNWISDIDTIKTRFPHCGNNCQVHEGFYRAFNFLRDDFVKNIKELLALQPTAQIYITGHSLGGAMATFAVIAANIELNRKVDKFYTIGSPRVGDENFSIWFKEANLSYEEARITHQCDPVPHLPPEAFGFRHIGNEIFYKSYKPTKNFFFFKADPTYVTCPEPEDKQCANSCLIPGDIPDHLTYFQLDFTLEIPICFA